MKILVAGDYILPGKVGGVQNYLINLMIGFRLLKGDFKIHIVVAQEAAHLFKFLCDDNRFNIISVNLNGITRNRILWEYIHFPEHIEKIRPDIIFFPNYYIPPIHYENIVATVHDLQFIHYPNYFTRTKKTWLHYWFKYVLRRSSKIIAISDYTKQDILKHKPYFANKIEMIHNPVIINNTESKPCFPLPRKYILSVAQQYPHKNINTLIKAFKLLNTDAQIVLVGQYDKLTPELKELASDIKERIIFTGYVRDNELSFIYKNAHAFVLPSLFEGFGMPLIEALEYGLPVITTKCTSIPEVTMGKALYVNNPLDPRELALGIEKVLKDKNKWAPSEETIKDITNKFSPQNIAQQYLQVFQKLIKS